MKGPETQILEVCWSDCCWDTCKHKLSERIQASTTQQCSWIPWGFQATLEQSPNDIVKYMNSQFNQRRKTKKHFLRKYCDLIETKFPAEQHKQEIIFSHSSLCYVSKGGTLWFGVIKKNMMMIYYKISLWSMCTWDFMVNRHMGYI